MVHEIGGSCYHYRFLFLSAQESLIKPCVECYGREEGLRRHSGTLLRYHVYLALQRCR